MIFQSTISSQFFISSIHHNLIIDLPSHLHFSHSLSSHNQPSHLISSSFISSFLVPRLINSSPSHIPLHQEESTHYQKKKIILSPSTISKGGDDDDQLLSTTSDTWLKKQDGIDLSGYMVEEEREPKKEKGIDIK